MSPSVAFVFTISLSPRGGPVDAQNTASGNVATVGKEPGKEGKEIFVACIKIIKPDTRMIKREEGTCLTV